MTSEKSPVCRARLTDGAVLPVPALAALALAIPAGAVLGAARVARPLVARGTRPTLLAAAAAAHAHAMRAAVRDAHLCAGTDGK